MTWTFDEINDRTGFANGLPFEDDDQVRDYFTIGSMTFFGWGPGGTQDELDDMAQAVIAHHWHYVEPGSAQWDQLDTPVLRVLGEVLDDRGEWVRVNVAQAQIRAWGDNYLYVDDTEGYSFLTPEDAHSLLRDSVPEDEWDDES